MTPGSLGGSAPSQKAWEWGEDSAHCFLVLPGPPSSSVAGGALGDSF